MGNMNGGTSLLTETNFKSDFRKLIAYDKAEYISNNCI